MVFTSSISQLSILLCVTHSVMSGCILITWKYVLKSGQSHIDSIITIIYFQLTVTFRWINIFYVRNKFKFKFIVTVHSTNRFDSQLLFGFQFNKYVLSLLQNTKHKMEIVKLTKAKLTLLRKKVEPAMVLVWNKSKIVRKSIRPNEGKKARNPLLFFLIGI